MSSSNRIPLHTLSHLSKGAFSNERVNLIPVHPPLPGTDLVVMVLIIPVVTLTLLGSISSMGTTTATAAAVVRTLLFGVVDLGEGRGGREREGGREGEGEGKGERGGEERGL